MRFAQAIVVTNTRYAMNSGYQIILWINMGTLSLLFFNSKIAFTIESKCVCQSSCSMLQKLDLYKSVVIMIAQIYFDFYLLTALKWGMVTYSCRTVYTLQTHHIQSVSAVHMKHLHPIDSVRAVFCFASILSDMFKW